MQAPPAPFGHEIILNPASSAPTTPPRASLSSSNDDAKKAELEALVRVSVLFLYVRASYDVYNDQLNAPKSYILMLHKCTYTSMK